MTNSSQEKGVEPIGKTIFDMVYQWGRVGVVVDYTAPAYQDEIKKLITQPESEGVEWEEEFSCDDDCYSQEGGYCTCGEKGKIEQVKHLLQAQDKQIRLEERERAVKIVNWTCGQDFPQKEIIEKILNSESHD